MGKGPQPGDYVDVGGVTCEAVAWNGFDSERLGAFAAALGKPRTVCGLCPASSGPPDLCSRTICGDHLLVPVELVGPLRLADVLRGEP